MIHTEHLLNATRRPLTSRRARKPPRSWVEQNEKERNWDGACTPGKELWRKKGSRTPGSPSPAGRPVWMEGELQSLEGECSNQSENGKMGSNLHRRSAPPPCTPQHEMLICRCGWGLGAEAQASEVRPRERSRVDCEETAWRGWTVATEGVLRRSLGPPVRLGGIQGARWDHHKGFFPCECSQAIGHYLRELWGWGQVATTIVGSRGRHGPPLPLWDSKADAKPCPTPSQECVGRSHPYVMTSSRQALPPPSQEHTSATPPAHATSRG